MTAIPPRPADIRAERLAILARLEQRARKAETPQALAFIMVNDTRGLTDYRRALFWDAGKRRLAAASGLAALDVQAPFALYLSRLCAALQDRDEARAQHEITPDSLPDGERADWDGHIAARLFWLPAPKRDGRPAGALILERDRPFSPAERPLLELLLDGYGHAWTALEKSRRGLAPVDPRSRRLWLGAAAALLLIGLFPVRQSVLAPAEIVAHRPAVLRAPLQAVVERILVRPNQEVAAGEAVAQLDPREWDSRLQTARQELAVADAEFRQAQQQALFDDRGKAGLAALKGRLEQARADVAFIEENLGRMRITTPRAGVAIFDDPSDWIGRPVALGERIMQIAAPAEGELEILLPIADAIGLAPGSEVRLFLNSEPASPLQARLERIGYRASPAPDGVMAYRLRAVFDPPDERIRVGLKGSAKLYGERTTLFGYLMRRPLTALRAHLGW